MVIDCLFCRMAVGEIEVEKLYEDDLVFAIRDINPRAPAHVLVIPKEHVPTARDLTVEQASLLGAIYGAANKVAGDLGLADRGYRLAVNVGDDGGQTIYHLHLHLLGGHKLGPEG
jgi:histidine triad (HIT) family protein